MSLTNLIHVISAEDNAYMARYYLLTFHLSDVVLSVPFPNNHWYITMGHISTKTIVGVEKPRTHCLLLKIHIQWYLQCTATPKSKPKWLDIIGCLVPQGSPFPHTHFWWSFMHLLAIALVPLTSVNGLLLSIWSNILNVCWYSDVPKL